ncbi:hypothetical protein F4775DRAFT_3367 [Biscogniauxia sp. FL1348]|nr:hypothetical protein F4775DRAFT_3367 [Biscogniauxia sp. FL1348]
MLKREPPETRKEMASCITNTALSMAFMQVIAFAQQRAREEPASGVPWYTWAVVFASFVAGLECVQGTFDMLDKNRGGGRAKYLHSALTVGACAAVTYSLSSPSWWWWWWCWAPLEPPASRAAGDGGSLFFLCADVFYRVVLWAWVAGVAEFKWAVCYRFAGCLESMLVRG